MEITSNASLDLGSDTTLHYLRPGFQLDPNDVEKLKLHQKRPIFHLSSQILVKRRAYTERTWNEAKNMLFIEKSTSIPLPRVYAVYTHGPLPNYMPGDNGHKHSYNTYIFMDLVPGATLGDMWEEYSAEVKLTIGDELKGYIGQLKRIPGGTYIGSINNGPVLDIILKYCRNVSKGPFATEKEFNNALRDAYMEPIPGFPLMATRMDELLAAHEYGIEFAHGDLHRGNIMVKDGHISGIIDWEGSGFYPSYWEYVNATRLTALRETQFHIFWDRILERPHCACLVMQELRDVLRC